MERGRDRGSLGFLEAQELIWKTSWLKGDPSRVDKLGSRGIPRNCPSPPGQVSAKPFYFQLPQEIRNDFLIFQSSEHPVDSGTAPKIPPRSRPRGTGGFSQIPACIPYSTHSSVEDNKIPIKIQSQKWILWMVLRNQKQRSRIFRGERRVGMIHEQLW